MSSLDPSEVHAVSRCNGLHTQLAVHQAIIHSFIKHKWIFFTFFTHGFFWVEAVVFMLVFFAHKKGFECQASTFTL